MTRFGVMKHLKVLEEARLVTTRKRGREKLHFLNPGAMGLVHDRWVSKYSEPSAAPVSELKHDIEEKAMEKVFEKTLLETGESLDTPGSLMVEGAR
jgi:DNA-binding transcriptional ArsR family regulator